MSLQYEGAAVDAGTMDVRSLAPALIATADAVREAHALLEVPGPSPRVEIRATRLGSFVVDLLLAEMPTLYQRAVAIFTSPPVVAAGDFAGLLLFIVNAAGFVKRIANRRISQVEETPDRAITRIILEDGTAIEIPSASFVLVSNAGFREALNGMVKPLAGDSGVGSLTLSAGDETETVTTQDLGAFEIPPAREEDLGQSDTEVVLRPVSVAFTEGNKWRFSDGDATFFATIEDPRFLAGVNLGTERFAKNDMLRVLLRTRQTRDASGLHIERSVIEVREHITGAVQLDLFATSGESLANATPPAPPE